ncbi:MAG: hypothetical protein J6U43_05395 [Bacteroidales bacterium]|nr:hypothetical protein [Bacteroidales bacterium]
MKSTTASSVDLVFTSVLAGVSGVFSTGTTVALFRLSVAIVVRNESLAMSV